MKKYNFTYYWFGKSASETTNLSAKAFTMRVFVMVHKWRWMMTLVISMWMKTKSISMPKSAVLLYWSTLLSRDREPPTWSNHESRYLNRSSPLCHVVPTTLAVVNLIRVEMNYTTSTCQRIIHERNNIRERCIVPSAWFRPQTYGITKMFSFDKAGMIGLTQSACFGVLATSNSFLSHDRLETKQLFYS